MTLDEIGANLDYFVEHYEVNELVLSGAEITARKDFRQILDRIAQQRLRLVTLLSSGLFWSPDLARGCAGIVDRVVVALTPPSQADWISIGGCSAKVLRSICLLQTAEIRVQTNTVLLRRVLPILEELAWTIDALDIQAPTFMFPFATGGLSSAFVRDVPSWEEARPIVLSALERLEPRRPKLKGVPPCYLGEAARFCSKTTQRILVEKRRQLQNHAVIPPFSGMKFFPECERCALRPRCDGFWPAYLESGMFPPLCPAAGVALAVVADPEAGTGC